MSDYALIIDYKYCTGCHSCEVACRKEKEIPIGQWGMKLTEHGPMIKDDGKCMWNFVPVPSDLCDMCIDRIERGEVPLCVQSCMSACMAYSPIEKIPEIILEKGPDHVVVFVP